MTTETLAISWSQPLYRDPVHDGAADPAVIWNPLESSWWMFYTNRRTKSPRNGVAWVHGTPISVASSPDGRTWTYRGDASGLETEWGSNTFWAPEVIEHDGLYHMFVTYIQGIPDTWHGHPRTIRHYTSPNLKHWTFISTLALSSDRVIDACVFPLPGGGFRLWYKDEADSSSTWAADSDDLYSWSVNGRVLSTPHPHEGPNVFAWQGSYWLLVDAKCQLLYRSSDLRSWEHVDTILDTDSGVRSGRTDDLGPGLHADVLVNHERAWVFYFTHPERHDLNLLNPNTRRSTIHVAELVMERGQVTCKRDAGLRLELVPPSAR